jgi:uncharacterized membrane protein
MGAILHLCTTFMLARIGATAPYTRVARLLPVNEMKILPPTTAKSQVLPFESGDVLIAACAFDATTAPVLIRSVLPSPGWSLALYSPTGENFYTIAGQESRRIDVQLMLVPSGDEFVPLALEIGAAQSRVLQVALPSRTGLALLRAPLPGQAWRGEIESDLRLSSCQVKGGTRP